MDHAPDSSHLLGVSTTPPGVTSPSMDPAAPAGAELGGHKFWLPKLISGPRETLSCRNHAGLFAGGPQHLEIISEFQTELHCDFGGSYLGPRTTCAFAMHTVGFSSSSSTKRYQSRLADASRSGDTAETNLPISVPSFTGTSNGRNSAPARSAGSAITSFFLEFRALSN